MERIKEIAISSLLISLFLLNSTIFSNIIIFGLLIIVFLLSYRSIFNKDIFLFKIIILYSLLLTFVVNVNQQIELSEYIRYFSLLIIFLIFPLNVEVKNKFFIVMIFITGILIFISQLGSSFGVQPINILIQRFYPIDYNVWESQSLESISGLNEYGSFKRFGGIYYNPNIMGQNIVLWCILFISILESSKLQISRHLLLIIVSYSITFLSLILSGSRTAMAVYAVFLLLKYYNVIKRKKILISLIIIAVLATSYQFFSELRIFQISSAITNPEGSLNIKFNILKDWLSNRLSGEVNLFNILFGDFDLGIQFDADLGYILSYFGIIGFFAIIFYLSKVFYLFKNKRYYFSIFLIGIGATVIMNFRFSIIALLILSIAYSDIVKKRLVYDTNNLVRTDSKSR
jgi:hypothetical protein